MKTRILVPLFALGMAACATTPSATTSAPSVAGRYGSACLSQKQADGSTTYYDLAFDITDKRWDLDYVVYGDDQCKNKLVTVKIAGPYEVGQPSKAAPGAYEATFAFDTKTITPHVDGLAGALAQMGCGSGTWKAGEGQSVFDDKGCPGFGQYPKSQCTADYDLVKVEGDKLQFGKRPADNNMCSPDKRPAELNPTAFTRK